MPRVNVIGLGYIGLPTALALAAGGAEVVGTDTNGGLVDTLKGGCLTFVEKGLDELFTGALKGGIAFQTECVVADIYIISVPTPYLKETKKIDPRYVVEAFEQVLSVCPDGAVIVIESTIPPGTVDKYLRPLTGGRQVALVHAPERILPGNMIHELKYNSRTIGADSDEAAKKALELYSLFCEGEIVLTDIRTAEMSKVVENTYRDINIAFANELAKLCHKSGIDVYELIRIANKHPRVNILSPGPGVGGHCISVDPWFLVGDYPEITKLILSAREVNDSMPAYVLERIREVMEEHGIKSFTDVGFYGLSYKENVDDVRESPTLQLIELMGEFGIEGFTVYDPHVKADIVEGQVHSMDEFLKKSQLVVILVGHRELINDMVKLSGKIILDTKNICGIEGTHPL